MAKATTAWVIRWGHDATVDLLDRDGRLVGSVEHVDVDNVRAATLVESTFDSLHLPVESVRVLEEGGHVDITEDPSTWVSQAIRSALFTSAASWSFGMSVL